MDCPVRGQSGTARPTGSMVGSSALVGPSGPGAQLGRGQGPSGQGAQLGRGKGRGEAATPDYAYPHPRMFALDSQRVIEPPAGSTSSTEPSHGTLVEAGQRQSRGSAILFCRVCSRRHVGRCRREPIICFTCGGEGHKFMDCPVRGQSGIERPTGSVVGSSTPVGPRGPGAQLGREKGVPMVELLVVWRCGLMLSQGVSAYDNRCASLAEGHRYWRIFLLHRSLSCALFPHVRPNVKKIFADDYKTWWSKTHGNFIDSYLQTLVDAAGPISTKISEVAPQGCRNATLKIGYSSASIVILSEQCKGKGSQLLIEAPTEQEYDQDIKGGKGSFPLSIVAHDSKKRSSQGESASIHEDYCWKKVRSCSNKSGVAHLVVVEISNSVEWPSRTLTVPFKKLSESDVDCASSLKEEVQVILEEMDGKDVDVSPLMRLMTSFFELSSIYDQARLTLHDKDMKVA
ncbi:hypothetical protein HAX54_041642 [Datura stramonium]|uniref:CCHC-type domain-containing protein n=1 Tax=Datura stramonium TaxID=4076 RepID=A0ABS8SLP0_DATST|nr:hypothetical protein [Datura stramonium]